MAYTLNEPVATEFLSVSQPKLRNNTNGADTSFGTDHYAFSNLSANNGKHNIIQSVPVASHPTTTTDTKTYSLVAQENIPPLLFTKGTSDVVATPLTRVNSASALFTFNPGTIQLLDFLDAPYCNGTVIFTGVNSSAVASMGMYGFLFNTNSSSNTFGILTVGAVTLSFIGTVLSMTNAGNAITNFCWTIDFNRIQS